MHFKGNTEILSHLIALIVQFVDVELTLRELISK